ncbi:hypothetical protein [Streptomyces fructofermentans]|uniref:hypothetical protein n=1 Tax=Streptomyces fructofermentans TaxID=152141 RepID=UPI0016792D17|nr:hypothetical protein [Streptomyces fructofermentans]
MAGRGRLPGRGPFRSAGAVCAVLLAVALTGCGDGKREPAVASGAPVETGAAGAQPSTTEPAPAPSDTGTPTVRDTPLAAAPDEEPDTQDEPDAAGLWGTRYTGTAEVAVDVYDFCSSDGSRRLADSRTYTVDSTLDLGRPRTGGGETEDNPFSLLFAAGDPADAGAVSFWSSAVGTASAQDLAGNPRDPQALLTYWDMDWSDGELDATLTDPHTSQAVALNLLNWSAPVVACRDDLGQLPGGFPHALASGTTLAGRLDDSGASLTGQGTSTDSLLEFRIEFTGTAQ